MSEPLSETEGCSLLARVFRARGYSIQRNVLFEEYGVSFHVDGWDPHARVGFEFLTSEDDDHDDLSLEEYKTLNMAQQRGELSLFIIDEVEPLTAQELSDEASEFLDEVDEAAQARRLAAARRAKAELVRGTVAAKGAVAAKPAAKPAKKPAKKPARQPVAKQVAAKVPAARKAVAKKPAAKPGAKAGEKTGGKTGGKTASARAVKQAVATAAAKKTSAGTPKRGKAAKRRPGR